MITPWVRIPFAVVAFAALACRGDGAKPRPLEATCVAVTCEDAGAQCGTIGDGCGGVLECGDCAAGETCGGGGKEHTCGAKPAQQGGATRWVLDVGGSGHERVSGLAVRDDGVIVAMTVIGQKANEAKSPEALGLVWISPDGKILHDRTYPMAGTLWGGPGPIAVSPLGNVFFCLAGPTCEGGKCPDLGAGPITSEILVNLSPEGDPLWTVPFPCYGDVVADRSGGVAAVGVPDPSTLVKYGWDGALEWRWTGSSDVADISAAFDADGNAIVGQALRVEKLDRRGARLWTGVVSEEAVANSIEGVGVYGVLDVAATKAGTAVAIGVYSKPLAIGGSTLPLAEAGRYGVFLAAFSGGDGKLLWAKPAGSAGPLGPPWPPNVVHVAAGGDGGIALLVAVDCELRVERWTSAGDRLWSRSIGPTCATGESLPPAGFGLGKGGDLVVGGGFDVPVDFGMGKLEGKGGTDGFVLDVAP